MFLITGLVIPASILVLAPVSPLAGIVTAIVLYLGIVTLLVLASPVIEVGDARLRAGRAAIDLALVGRAEGFTPAEAIAQRGTKLDARAWLMIRGWIGPVVRVPIIDDADPVPYWLVSTRHPAELAAAINGSRPSASAE
jgi:hypothetical protein